MTNERTLYKALVRMRWKNASTGWIEAAGGEVLEFDDGDFGGINGLSSIEDLIARGVIAEFDPADARNVDKMSRDEMLELLVAAGRAEGLTPQVTADVIKPMVEALLADQDAAAAAEAAE